MDNSYWQKQEPGKALFPEIEWSKPEQRSRAGKLGIVGGNSSSFAGVAESYSTATRTGVGSSKVLLPSILKKTIPASMTDVVFGDTNPSGSLSKKALPELLALGHWADSVLLIGDCGKNSETAILYEEFISTYDGALVISRDAVDLLRNNSSALIEREKTTLVVSLSQLQKIFQSVYYPKMIAFSMNISQLVETLHKFTITYPATIAVFHNENFIVAQNGKVVTTEWQNAMAIWRGVTATQIACYQVWNPDKPLEAAVSALVV